MARKTVVQRLLAKKILGRKGCDLCKADPPTELFEGRLGNLLWFCEPCFNVLTTWRKPKVRK